MALTTLHMATITMNISAGLKSLPPSPRIVNPLLSNSSHAMVHLKMDFYYFTKKDTNFHELCLLTYPRHHFMAPALHLPTTVSFAYTASIKTLKKALPLLKYHR